MKIGNKELFKKSKSYDVTPDFEAFYQDTNKTQTTADVSKGVAALLGFMTLCAAMLLVLGLFFGARWIYRSTNDSKALVVDTSMPEKGTVITPDSNSSITIPNPVGNGAVNISNPATSGSSTTGTPASTPATSSTSTLPSTAEQAPPINTIPKTGITL